MYQDPATFIASRLPAVKKQEEIDAITEMIRSASAFVDKATGRKANYFGAAGVATTRHFRGDGTNVLRIPQHITGTATVENVPLAAYYEHPESGWLYKYGADQLSELGWNGAFDGFPVWTKNRLYTVAAQWGFAAIPDDIAEAVAQITLRWWQTTQGTLGEISPNGFVIERDVPPAAAAILAQYTRGEFEI